MKKVVTLHPVKMNIPMNDRHLRVAAYCRVSTEHEEQDGSIELQEDYFRAVNDGNRNWTNAGIFSERTTGLKLKNRKQFNAMIRKCKSGKIDLILTKSISRFGRNTLDELKASGREFQDEFDLRLRAFSDLRRRGLVVKTGFKYGTHFRVYEKSPDDCHARYLVHSVSGTNRTMWPEISRAVRLSGGVKKEILFCRVTDRTEYMEFKWFRP